MLENSILIDGKDAKTIKENLKVIVELNQQAKDLEESIAKAIENIKTVLGDDAFNQAETLKYELACGGVFSVTKSTVKTQVDSSKLKKEKPDVYAEYSKSVVTKGYIDKKSIVL